MTLDVRGRTVVVVGLAASGMAAVRVLRDEGAEVRISEAATRERVADAAAAAEELGAEVLAGGHAAEHLRGADLVVTSPGVPEDAPVLAWAHDRGIPVWSEIELGARLASAPCIAVTGTNGKTTTSEMIAAALRADGRDAVACGNAGHPFSLAATEAHDVLVVEVSSFQLRFHRSFHPRVSVLLNVAPDHLDWHGGLEAYASAKARIYACQGEEDLHVGNADDPLAAELSRAAPCPVAWTTLGKPGEGQVGFVEGRLVARLDGEHDLGPIRPATPPHLADAAAAAAAALGFGAAAAAVGEALREFRPLPHRGEIVARLGDVAFVDDSKATNPQAALASIAGWERVVLVAGGLAKGVDLRPLASAAPRLVGVVAIGEAADEVARVFEGLRPVVRAGSIEDAAARAVELARPDGTVLLAPACASQDMFRDYAERGERFAAAARALSAREAG